MTPEARSNFPQKLVRGDGPRPSPRANLPTPPTLASRHLALSDYLLQAVCQPRSLLSPVKTVADGDS